MKIKKIVINGMRGRKKDTKLLMAVVILSFLFISTASILLSSMDETERTQRISQYGKWQVLVFDVDDQNIQAYAQEQVPVQARLAGVSADCGLVASIDASMVDLGSLKVSQGTLPQSKDEILLTRTSMEAMGKVYAPGDQVELQMVYDHVASPAVERLKQFEDVKEMFRPYIHRLSDEVYEAFNTWWDAVGHRYTVIPGTGQLTSSELEQEDYLTMLGFYLSYKEFMQGKNLVLDKHTMVSLSLVSRNQVQRISC